MVDENELLVLLYIGGKGRVIGTRFEEILREELFCKIHIDEQQTEAKAMTLVNDRLAVYGAEAPVNIGGNLRLQMPALISSRAWNYDDSLQLCQTVAIHRFVHHHPEIYGIAELRAYFEHVFLDIACRARGRNVRLLLVDEMVSIGFTKRFAIELCAYARQWLVEKGVTLALTVEDRYMNLAPNFDHLPSHFLRRQMAANFPHKRLLAAILQTDLTHIREEDLQRKALAATAKQMHFDGKKFLNFAGRISTGVHNYVLRGGFHNEDPNGNPLITLQRYPNDLLIFHSDIGTGKFTLEIDTTQAVRAYNWQFDRFLLENK